MKEFLETWVPPTEAEDKVIQWLHERIKSVSKSGEMHPGNLKAVMSKCSVISLTNRFCDEIDPRILALMMKKMVAAGFIKEYTFDGLPAFLPISKTTMTVCSTKEITQKDIDSAI